MTFNSKNSIQQNHFHKKSKALCIHKKDEKFSRKFFFTNNLIHITNFFILCKTFFPFFYFECEKEVIGIPSHNIEEEKVHFIMHHLLVLLINEQII